MDERTEIEPSTRANIRTRFYIRHNLRLVNLIYSETKMLHKRILCFNIKENVLTAINLEF